MWKAQHNMFPRYAGIQNDSLATTRGALFYHIGPCSSYVAHVLPFLFFSLCFTGDNNGLCKVRFYYHMYGPGIGTLRVLAADRYSSRTLWSKSFSQNVNWTRAEVQLANMYSSFIVSLYLFNKSCGIVRAVSSAWLSYFFLLPRGLEKYNTMQCNNFYITWRGLKLGRLLGVV